MFLISNALIIIDQFTKFMAASRIPLHDSIPVIDNFFHITHIRNSGVAFGLFAGQAENNKATFFVAISLVAIAAILGFFHRTPERHKLSLNGLILIFSGAIGNLIDRILHREVIDFIYFFYKDFHFPAFNIADSCITIGVGLMFLDMFLNPSGSDPSAS